MKTLTLIPFFLILFITLSCQAQLNEVNNVLASYEKDSTLRHASWSFCLLENESGKIICQKDKDISLLPASSMKTITTATALALLGGDFRYTTTAYYTGKIDAGILHGDIVIKGSGDPTLGSTRFDSLPDYHQLATQIKEAIKQANIQEIEGRILVDESCFSGSTIPFTWNWSDIANYYGAGASGFIINENSYDIYFAGAIQNNATPILLRTEPSLPSLHFINHLLINDTVENLDDAYVFGPPYDNNRTLEGVLPFRKSEIKLSGAMPDPAYFFANLLYDSVIAAKISVKYPPTTSRLALEAAITFDKKGTVIFTHQSLPLQDIVKLTNQKSINVYAEALLKTIALSSGKEATTANGIDIVEKYWQSKGIDLDGFHMMDGSGLSRHNAVSSYHFVQILYQLTKEKFGQTFKNSLAVAGRSGTLKGLGKGTIAEGNIYAKSGTVERGISYTGYVNTKTGGTLSFSIIFNNYNGKNLLLRQKIVALMIAMVGIDT